MSIDYHIHHSYVACKVHNHKNTQTYVAETNGKLE